MKQRYQPVLFVILTIAIGLCSKSVSAQNQPASPPSTQSNTKSSEDKPAAASTKRANRSEDTGPKAKITKTDDSPRTGDKKPKSKAKAKKSERFVDRNGDGIQDGMERRFRRTHRNKAAATGRNGERRLRQRRNQHRFGPPSQSDGNSR